MNRFVRGLVCLLLVGIPYWWLFLLAAPARPLLPDPDTTLFTGPLDRHGFVDFAAALNASMTPLPPERNAVFPLMELDGCASWDDRTERADFAALVGQELPPPGSGSFSPFPLPDTRLFPIDEPGVASAGKPAPCPTSPDELPHRMMARRPWQRVEHPEVATWLAGNDAAFRFLASAAACDGIFWPRRPGCSVSELGFYPFLQRDNHVLMALRALESRAMLRCGEGDRRGMFEDLSVILRTARHLAAQDQILPALIGSLVFQETLWQVLPVLRERDEDGTMAAELLQALEALPPVPDGYGGLLNEVVVLPLAVMNDLARDPGRRLPLTATSGVPWTDGLDFNVLMQRVLQPGLPLLRAAADPSIPGRIRVLAEQARQADERAAGLRGKEMQLRIGKTIFLTHRWAKAGAVAELVGDILMAIAGPRYTSQYGSTAINPELVGLFRIACSLRLFRKDHGRYPESLIEPLPKLASVPYDLFAEAPHRYRREGEGFLLYSIGPDLDDDCGKPLPPTNSDDGDLVIRFDR